MKPVGAVGLRHSDTVKSIDERPAFIRPHLAQLSGNAFQRTQGHRRVRTRLNDVFQRRYRGQQSPDDSVRLTHGMSSYPPAELSSGPRA